MRFIEVNALKDSDGSIRAVIVKKYGNPTDGVHKVTVVVGGTYIVKPKNPLKKRNRDRIVVVRKFIDDRNGIKASVRFKDNNRLGRIDVAELENIEKSK